jgi:DNA polymerase/3'-5' exonuclease PolX
MIITNPKNKKHIEGLVEYCKKHGMEPMSTMALWNELVYLIKRIEKYEEAPKNTAPNKRKGGSRTSAVGPNGFNK